MKILVTGGAGFIGSAVVRLSIARGHSVMNIDALTYAACLDNVAIVAGDPNYAFEQVDIRNRAALVAVFAKHRPDTVMHLAAESHVDIGTGAGAIVGMGAVVTRDVPPGVTVVGNPAKLLLKD